MIAFYAFVAALSAQSLARAELLEADSAWRAEVSAKGLRTSLGGRLAPDVVLLYPGAPVIETEPAVVRFLDAQPGLDTVALSWSAAHVWLSAAGDFGVVYGQSAIGRKAPHRGVLIAAWRRDAAGWRLTALLVSAIASPDAAVLSSDLPVTHPRVDGPGALRAMTDADLAFAEHAGKRGAVSAFEAFAATEAVLLGGPEPTRGPAAIGRALAARPTSTWEWHPVAARGASAGDLGITVGESIITPVAEPRTPNYGKYLTVWARQADGTMRYLTDGGTPRPSNSAAFPPGRRDLSAWSAHQGSDARRPRETRLPFP